MLTYADVCRGCASDYIFFIEHGTVKILFTTVLFTIILFTTITTNILFTSTLHFTQGAGRTLYADVC
jgi:hypothetical protein